MTRLTPKFGGAALVAFIASVFIAMTASHAHAATATYLSPSDISESDLAALSTSGDNAGFLVGENQLFSLLINPALSPSQGSNITIFTLAPDTGSAHALVRIGSYNNGSPTIIGTRQVKAGNSVSIGNLFQTGCGVLSGCDYIEIITNKTKKGADGVEIDYIEVDGEIVEVVSPAPELSTWGMMIIGFIFVAARLKKIRRAAPQPPPVMARC